MPRMMIGRNSAIRSALTHVFEPVRSKTSTVSATAARYVPAPEPSVARKSRRKSLSLRLRHVAQVRGQPALGLCDGPHLAPRVVLDLVARDPPDGEVARLRMAEEDAADGCRRRHGVRLGQSEADLLGAEQVEERPLLGVVRARRVA